MRLVRKVTFRQYRYARQPYVGVVLVTFEEWLVGPFCIWRRAHAPVNFH
ncbi:hypothetical protein FEP82_05995 [Burkholderia multivorans]|nr:hypothetical protein [Burkholderia multivorans]MDR8828954.1 hypothetical protein [Burkholderia multivorans]